MTGKAVEFKLSNMRAREDYSVTHSCFVFTVDRLCRFFENCDIIVNALQLVGV
jgi:hypothetical protein